MLNMAMRCLLVRVMWWAFLATEDAIGEGGRLMGVQQLKMGNLARFIGLL